MRTSLTLFALLVVAVVFLFAPSAATAQQGIPYWPAWGYGTSPYSLSNVPTPPYFAIHPPVYYSYPVPRTYGYSPFAYPPCVRTPDVMMPAQPAEIINPHVQPQSLKAEAKVAAKPKTIVNPFCADDILPASTGSKIGD